MRDCCVLMTVLVLLVMLAPAVGVAGETVARGDIEFYLDGAVFRTSDGGALQEIYLRFANAEVRYKSSGGKLESRVMVSILIRDREGKEVVKNDREHKFYADDEREATSGLDFQTLIMKYPLAAGHYTLFCAVQDLNAPKITVVGMMKGQVRSSVVEKYPLEVPVFSTENMTLSDGEFLWDIRQVGGQVVYNPNPSRLYGLYKDSLQVYIEAYVPKTVAESGDLQLRSEILDERGEIASESSIAVPTQSVGEGDTGVIQTVPLVITVDLNQFPAGKYVQYIHVGLADQSLVRVPVGSFSVAWDMRVWETTRRNFLAEARFLIGEDEDFDSFAEKTTGEQEAILSAMWKTLDPDTNTGVNEAYEKFSERLTYVSARYVDYQLGLFTDRGLIYLKYGPPDDKIADVIPANRETASDAFEVVRDRFHTINFSVSGGRAGYATPSRDIIVDPRRMSAVGEGGNVAYPYELWIYLGSGDPIRERDQNMEATQGLRFIFVDREGWGRYKLESSSAMTPK